MQHLCEQCNICTFLPEQKHKRVLGLQTHPEQESVVLVIDDCQSLDEQGDHAKWLRDNLLFIPFTHTSTVRCEYDSLSPLNPGEFEQAVEQCAVWTHHLLDGKAVVITTETGLHQLQVGEGKKRGDMFRHPRVGAVLVIPPVSIMMTSKGFVTEYQPRIQRVLKEVGLA